MNTLLKSSFFYIAFFYGTLVDLKYVESETCYFVNKPTEKLFTLY